MYRELENYDDIIEFGRFLVSFKGYDMSRLFEYLESPYKWETEYNAYVDMRQDDGAWNYYIKYKYPNPLWEERFIILERDGYMAYSDSLEEDL